MMGKEKIEINPGEKYQKERQIWNRPCFGLPTWMNLAGSKLNQGRSISGIFICAKLKRRLVRLLSPTPDDF